VERVNHNLANWPGKQSQTGVMSRIKVAKRRGDYTSAEGLFLKCVHIEFRGARLHPKDATSRASCWTNRGNDERNKRGGAVGWSSPIGTSMRPNIEGCGRSGDLCPSRSTQNPANRRGLFRETLSSMIDIRKVKKKIRKDRYRNLSHQQHVFGGLCLYAGSVT